MKTEMYRIVFSNDAKKDLKELSKKAPLAIKKLSKLLEEIQEHPRTGTGQVEPLKGYDGDVYSRRITHEHFRAVQEVANFARNIIWPRITVVMWGLFYSLNTNHLWHSLTKSIRTYRKVGF